MDGVSYTPTEGVMYKIVLAAIAAALVLLVANCGSQADGGNDATITDNGFADSSPVCLLQPGVDANCTPQDVMVSYAPLKVTSNLDDMGGAEVYLDGVHKGKTPLELEVEVGVHELVVNYPGRIQGPDSTEVEVVENGSEVHVVMYYDLTGKWRRESDGKIDEVAIFPVRPIDKNGCPDANLAAGPFSPFGGLCLEADDSLSLCKYHAKCPPTATWVTDGKILNNGTRVEYTAKWDPALTPNPDSNPGEQHFAYVKISP